MSLTFDRALGTSERRQSKTGHYRWPRYSTDDTQALKTSEFTAANAASLPGHETPSTASTRSILASVAMTDDELRVANLIRSAFEGVTLGNGVGLMQAQGLDDYLSHEVLDEYRLQDEKEDWTAISAEKLNRCHSSLSFFDPEGMRFHLPAFLIGDLDGTFDFGVVFRLTYTSAQSKSDFSLFTATQRMAIREYLMLRLADPQYDFEHDLIERSLARDWPEPSMKDNS